MAASLLHSRSLLFSSKSRTVLFWENTISYGFCDDLKVIVENHKELVESVRYLRKCCSEFSEGRRGGNTKLMSSK